MADTLPVEGMVGQPPRTGNPETAMREAGPGGITQWGAVLAGAFAGFAAALLMGTLGAALGITAGAIGLSSAEAPMSDAAERAAAAVGIGTVVWTLLTAIVVGIVAGWALNRTARSERQYFPLTFGTLTWATSVFLMLLVLAPGWGGLLAGFGGAAGARGMDMTPRQADRPRSDAETGPRSPADMTEEERAQAKSDAEKVAQAAAAGSWLLFCGQVVSLASTILAAGWRRPARAHLRTEIRLRPAASAP